MEGYGKIKERDGSTYVGQLKEDKFHGLGKAVFNARNIEHYGGVSYEGDWCMGQRHGFGTLTKVDGS